jgi:hypothetical protein
MITNSILSIITIATILSLITIIEAPSTVYAGKDSEKELCKENDVEWEDGVCDFKTDDEDKADQFTEYVEKIKEFEEEKAAIEDALCDDEDAETTNIEICSSQDFTLGEAFAENTTKKKMIIQNKEDFTFANYDILINCFIA